MKVLYRIDNFEQKRGVWRDWDGNWKPVFDEFLQNGVSKDVPMEDNKIYQGGWFAATESLETLIPHWVSFDDLRELYEHGWVVQAYIAEEQYTKKMNDYETIFLKKNALPYFSYNNPYALEFMMLEPPKLRLTDNEVKEVAKMQQELDAIYYMMSHLVFFAQGRGDGHALIASSDDFVNTMVRILYNFIKEHRETKNEEK